MCGARHVLADLRRNGPVCRRVLHPAAGGPGRRPGTPRSRTSTRRRTCERFFIDLGINSVDVIVLAPLYDARDAYSAASNGDYLTAVLLAGATSCEVAKSCAAVAGPLRGVLGSSASVRRSTRPGTEIVQRAMSRAELEATINTGLLRGGRPGTHYVSDAVNTTGNRARARLALPTRPEVRATMEVPDGTFSSPSTVAPYRLPDGTVLRGGGTERTAAGDVPVRVIKVDDL